MADNFETFFNCVFHEKEKVFKGNQTHAKFDPSLSLGQVLFESLKQNSNNILQIDDANNTTITNAQALQWGIRIALYLKKLAFDHTDIVGISSKNSTYLLPVVLGCYFNGTPFHAVNPVVDEETLTHCYGLTRPKMIFCDGEVYAKLKITTTEFCQSIITLTGRLEGLRSVEELLLPVAGEQNYAPTPLVEGEQQTVTILCSSGTTGKPKAVCIAKPGILIENVFLKRDTCMFNSSGIDWYTGLWAVVTNCLSHCKRVISTQPFSIDLFLELVNKYKISYVLASARHAAMLVEHPKACKESLAALKIINFGGNSLSEATLLRLNALFPEDVVISFAYGITEVGPVAFNLDRTHPKSVGKLFPNLSVKIINNNGEDLGINEVGEVLIRTAVPWKGYYNNPIETAKAIGSDFWFHTGDVGYFDENLLLYLIDRKKEICKYQGNHYWPNEIQCVISELSDVKDVCVVPYKDDKDGDLAGALVVKAENSRLTTDMVVQHVEARLKAHHKQLHAGAYFVERLPYNSNNKCIRSKAQLMLKELYGNKIDKSIL